MERKRQRGFSLIELMVVLVVVGLLLAIGSPALRRYLDSYKVADSARQIANELRMARQKAVSNDLQVYVVIGVGAQSGLYFTGVSRQTTLGTWSPVVYSSWNLPPNTKPIAINIGGTNGFRYKPNGRPYDFATGANAVSGSLKVVSTNGSVRDTIPVNLELTGEVWQ